MIYEYFLIIIKLLTLGSIELELKKFYECAFYVTVLLFFIYLQAMVTFGLMILSFAFVLIIKHRDNNYISYFFCKDENDCINYLRGKDKTDIYILKYKLKRLEKISLTDTTIIISAVIAGLKYLVFEYIDVKSDNIPKITFNTTYHNEFINHMIFILSKTYGNADRVDFYFSSIYIIAIFMLLYFIKERAITNFKRIFYKRNI